MAVHVSATKVCGFCATGNHERCYIGSRHEGRHEKYPQGVVWACACESGGCTKGRLKCVVCGNRNMEEIDPSTWTCLDVESCQATVETRRANSPFLAQLREIEGRVQMARIENDKATKTAKAKTGTCVCGCKGTTKGGKFLPGHDARFVSTLVTTVADAKFTKASEASARKSLKEVEASEKLVGKFNKSLGIARDKADAKAEAEKAKAEKAKADANA